MLKSTIHLNKKIFNIFFIFYFFILIFYPIPSSAAEFPIKKIPNLSEKSEQISLDQAIKILENDQPRKQLLSELKMLKQHLENQNNNKNTDILNTLKAIAHNQTEAITNAAQDWKNRWQQAKPEWMDILNGQHGEQLVHLIFRFLEAATIWALTVVFLKLFIKFRFSFFEKTRKPSEIVNIVYALRHHCIKLIPWAGAFIVALLWQASLAPSSGRLLLLISAYAILVGLIFSSLSKIVFSSFNAMHCRTAVQILLKHSSPYFIFFAISASLGNSFESTKFY